MKKLLQVSLAVIIQFSLIRESLAVGASGLSTQFVGAKALGQGNAFVGQADDPSAIYFNPAGITQLSGTQLSVGGSAVIPMVTRSGGGVPDDKMKRELSLLPNFYATSSATVGSKKIAYGVGLNSPFGLSTKWSPTSSVRYSATESAFQMVNVNPTVAIEVTPRLSIGIGADYVNLFNVETDFMFDQSGVGGSDGSTQIKGDGQGWGYNGGILYKPFEKHSIGASYRSKVQIPIKGTLNISNIDPTVQALYNFNGSEYSADATSSFTLPQSVILGYAYRPNDHWTLVGDYEWTQWNSFQSQDVAVNESDSTGGISGEGRLGLITGSQSNVYSVPRDWRNVSSLGLGANYANNAWQYRGGYAYYQRAVPQETFTPDIPDAAIHNLTLGTSYSWPSVIIDFAFNAYIYTTRNINNASTTGKYTTFAPAFALNLTYKFGK